MEALDEIVDIVSTVTGILTALVGAIAAISLLVGGIGIMNIMLVSVTERTREIGIRLAIGALPGQIMAQFLTESVVLCLIGGILGVALGLGAAAAAVAILDVEFALNPIVVPIAFGFAAAGGVIFGFMPARRAANLDPIVALRRE